MIKRHEYALLRRRLREPRRFIQVLAGPRQCGKTTLVHQVTKNLGKPVLFVSADGPVAKSPSWISQEWATARSRAAKSGAVLVFDEIQKVPQWSEVVKQHWDEDTANKETLRVVLLGSAPLLIQKGLTESLAGRFEVIRLSHWSYEEIKRAFRFSLDEYLFFGGYPGAAALIKDGPRWRDYITESIIETTVSRDILLLNRVDKPALLRRLFHLGCLYSGQMLSYQKILGQLQDAGNTTTLAHYLDLLSGAGLLTGLVKFSGNVLRQRASSPKFLVLNNALLTAQSDYSFDSARQDREFWGRLVESAVGAHILTSGRQAGLKIFYWREGDKEVDFVVQRGAKLTGIEVKSGRPRDVVSGLDAFSKKWNPARQLLVGANGIAIEDFLSKPVDEWVA